MKKLLGILVLGLLLNGNAYAYIYDCKIKDTFANGISIEANLVINVDGKKYKPLVTIHSESGNFTDEDIIVGNNPEGQIGQMILTSQTGGFLRKKSYEIYVTRNNKPGNDDYFTAVFNEKNLGTPGLMHMITISPWDMKIYIFLSDRPKKVFKGICK